MTCDARKAPFPWFGGKSRAAAAVWQALGDPEHYVEPFAGSMAVLLARNADHTRHYHSETVNDADGLLVNAWRSIQLSPDLTAEHAAWPVSEADMHARHLALLAWRREHQLEHLMGDPAWHDPQMAGWWLWGVACWIGSGWCSGVGPWVRGEDGRIVLRERPGVNRKRPHLGDDGMGVNSPIMRAPLDGVWRQLPQLSNNGKGIMGPALRAPLPPHPGGSLATEPLRAWCRALADRLRWVRIVNGDWRRVCTRGAIETLSVRQGGTAGVFLDPPYSDRAGRAGDLYTAESLTVAHDVREWCLEHTASPWRIVLAGYEGEHPELTAAGWREVEWFAGGWLAGGYGNEGEDGHQQARERLWLSPACLRAREPAQRSLFAGLGGGA